jgi:hypothetical protein
MSTEPFNFVRNVQVSRFTIDVLIQRLNQLKPRRHCGPEEYERLLGKTYAGVACCNYLLKDFRERFCEVHSFDAGSIASASAAFEDLQRRIAESITNCNILEFGPPH